jgi:hypothetical protein
LALVKTIRGAGVKSPVLFLTAVDGIGDRVEGLEAGDALQITASRLAGQRTQESLGVSELSGGIRERARCPRHGK